MANVSAKQHEGLVGEVRALLADPRSPSLLSVMDLVSLALFLKPDHRVSGATVLATLQRGGWQISDGGRALERSLDAALELCPALSAHGGEYFLTDPARVMRDAARAVREARASGLLDHEPDGVRREAPEGRPPGRRSPPRERRIEVEPTPKSRERRHPREMDQLRDAVRALEHFEFDDFGGFDGFDDSGGFEWRPEPTFTERLIASQKIKVKRKKKQPRPKQAARPRRSSPPRASEASAGAASAATRPRSTAGAPGLEPPPAVQDPTVIVDHALSETLPVLYDLPAAPLDRLGLSLRAHQLAAAGQFSELWCLSTLSGVDFHAYQVETVRRVLRSFRGRALLADEVGLGKTVEAMMVLREYQMRGLVRRALVLTPPALVTHWKNELATKASVQARTTTGSAFKSDAEFWQRAGVVVASLATARSARHHETVVGEYWDLVIIDEAHHVKNRRTLGYKLVNRLKSRFLLLLTATPVETDLEEIYNLVTLLKPGVFATPADFRQRYVDRSDPTSPKNRERLRGLLSEVMVRNTRADSGLKLPPRFVTTLVVEPGADERSLYERVLRFTRNHGQGATRHASATLLLEAGSAPAALRASLERYVATEKHGPTFTRDAGELLREARAIGVARKDAAVRELIEARDQQTLVFTRYRASAESIAGFLEAGGLEVVRFHGGLDAEQKRTALERFRAGARCLVSTDVGGEGQNLQFCQLLINYDLPWNPMLIEQRIGRLHRMGQTEPVNVFNLCAQDTVEQRLLEVLDARLHLFELVVGEMDMVLGNVENEHDLEDRIFELYRSTDEPEMITRGFDKIAEELLQARRHYEKARALDEALFRRDYQA